MDTLASLALATEPPTQELLKRKPHSRDEYIVTKVITLIIRKCSNILSDKLFSNFHFFYLLFYKVCLHNLGEKWIPEIFPDELDDYIELKVL